MQSVELLKDRKDLEEGLLKISLSKFGFKVAKDRLHLLK